VNTSFNDSKAGSQNVHIQNHLAIASLLFAVAAFTTLAVGWVSMNIVRSYHEPQVHALLRSELTAGKDRLESYLHEAARGLINVAAAHVSQPVLADFEVGFHELGENAEVELQRAYITDNPNPIGRKQELLFSPDNTLYSRVHEKYHGWFKQILDTHDFYDIFLVSARGDIIYSVYKESDFATNLVTGNFRETELSKTFQKIEENPIPTSTVFSDFVEYKPSNFEPAAFIGTPISSNGQFRGALIAQIKTAPINSTLDWI